MQKKATAVLLGALLTVASTAHAHISISQGGTHEARYADTDLKVAPCGRVGGRRGDNVYTYRPGATINLSLVETVSHPGYFRIAFDSDGDDDFKVPSGTAGEFGDCGGNAMCGAGREDYCNNETVLLDNLDPHEGNLLAPAKTYTWSVTLPNIECDNCTLQVMQMMNDFAPFHSPASYPADDIYYNCIDIVLSNDAPESTDVPVENNGIACERPAGEMAGTDEGDTMTPEPGPAAEPATDPAGEPTPGTDPGMMAGAPTPAEPMPAAGTEAPADPSGAAPPMADAPAAPAPSATPAPTPVGATPPATGVEPVMAGMMATDLAPVQTQPVSANGAPGVAQAPAAASSGDSGGCSVSAGAGHRGPVFLGALGLIGLWRMRRRRRGWAVTDRAS